MTRPLAKLIPLLARRVAPAVIAASGMFAPVALGGNGDLDPDFADVGRLGPIPGLEGPAWSLAVLDNDDILLAGGDFKFVCQPGHFCDLFSVRGFDATNFVRRLSAEGSVDPSLNAARLAHTQVFDVISQPDGKLVAVGRRVSTTSTMTQLIVFRLQPNGPLDTTFGNGGIVELSIADHGQRHVGLSIDLDPSGRIVVAGSRNNELIVLRLLANGSFDGSFGTSGIFVGQENYYSVFNTSRSLDAGTHLLRVAGGGYRVTISSSTGCQVVALTAGGALDNAYGAAGIADINAPWGPAYHCSSILAQPDGRLLVAGSAGEQGFVTRLLTSGSRDSSFSRNAVADILTNATALALGDDGSILVAGVGVDGASIMRLLANGGLDASFGNAGSTLIDLPSEFGTHPVVHETTVRPNGGVVAAGGDDFSRRPFVIRLLGASGRGVPGVLGVTQQRVVPTAEGTQLVAVNVRRTGGDSGSVSVAYRTTVTNDSRSATAGQDFVDVSGRLTWGDGDTAQQEIRVPILANTPAEEFEFFRVLLSDPQGGAGLGTRNASVEILADGDPFGQFAIEPGTPTVNESQSARVNVYRNFYDTGAVSVTVTPIGGTATAGDDFAPQPVTVSWADGERGSVRTVEFAIRDDAAQETAESFTVELSNPTGGAIVGPRSSVTITIAASDQPTQPPPPPPPPPRGGGGATGLELLVLLGLLNALAMFGKRRLGRGVKPSPERYQEDIRLLSGRRTGASGRMSAQSNMARKGSRHILGRWK